MQKYFISTEELNNRKITSSDAFHIRNVMRSKIDDLIIVACDEIQYKAKITEITNDYVAFLEVEKLENLTELPVNVHIFQGYAKGDKMDEIVKHSTELGATSIVATMMKRSIVKLEDKKISSRIERFKKIAKEAAEQSFRVRIPSVSIETLKKIDFSSYDLKLVCYEENAKNNELVNFKRAIKGLILGQNVAVVIGPEGGIDKDELDYLTNLGFIPCALGPRILRTETASFYVLSSISYELELKE